MHKQVFKQLRFVTAYHISIVLPSLDAGGTRECHFQYGSLLVASDFSRFVTIFHIYVSRMLTLHLSTASVASIHPVSCQSDRKEDLSVCDNGTNVLQ